jgi:hypothetical protein
VRFVEKARKLIRAGRSRTLTATMVPAAGTIRPPSLPQRGKDRGLYVDGLFTGRPRGLFSYQGVRDV